MTRDVRLLKPNPPLLATDNVKVFHVNMEKERLCL